MQIEIYLTKQRIIKLLVVIFLIYICIQILISSDSIKANNLRKLRLDEYLQGWIVVTNETTSSDRTLTVWPHYRSNINNTADGGDDVIVILVQVNKRVANLKVLIESLRFTRGIEKSHLVFSHDFVCNETTQAIRAINFTTVIFLLI